MLGMPLDHVEAQINLIKNSTKTPIPKSTLYKIATDELLRTVRPPFEVATIAIDD